MKVVMFNDCAFVGETLLRYLPPSFEKEHVKRSRGLLSKTFGISWRILRSKADVYHANYLLQDCYVALKLGKHPLVGHAMGSDVRQSITSRKWGFIVRSNLRSCDKILCAQPTILDTARRFSKNAEYFPIPFDPALFHPNQQSTGSDVKRVVIASVHDFAVKGTDKFLRALGSISMPLKVTALNAGRDLLMAKQLARQLKLDATFIGRVPHEKMSELYWGSDLVLGSFGVGQLDTVAIEAMACGRPVVHSVAKGLFEGCPLEDLQTVEETASIIQALLGNDKHARKRVQDQLSYVESVHSAPLLAERLSRIYSGLAGSG